MFNIFRIYTPTRPILDTSRHPGTKKKRNVLLSKTLTHHHRRVRNDDIHVVGPFAQRWIRFRFEKAVAQECMCVCLCHVTGSSGCDWWPMNRIMIRLDGLAFAEWPHTQKCGNDHDKKQKLEFKCLSINVPILLGGYLQCSHPISLCKIFIKSHWNPTMIRIVQRDAQTT